MSNKVLSLTKIERWLLELLDYKVQAAYLRAPQATSRLVMPLFISATDILSTSIKCLLYVQSMEDIGDVYVTVNIHIIYRDV